MSARDSIWFGVIFCINVQIAYLTPPISASALYLKSLTPPALVIAFPQIALWLPSQMW